MRSDLFFKHDIYAVDNDPVLRAICAEYPVWGEAVFFRAVARMYINDGKEYPVSLLVIDIARDLFTDNRDKVEELVLRMISDGLFQKNENGKIVSNRVCAEIRSAKKRKKEQSEKGKKGMESRYGKTKSNGENDLSNSDFDNTTITGVRKDDNSGYSSDTTEGLPKSNRNLTEQDKKIKEQDIKEKVSTSVDTQKEKEIPYTLIMEKWNEICTPKGFPRCTTLSDKRRKAMKACWLAYGEKVYEAFSRAASSEFLTSWSGCGFDWIFNTNNMLKVLEGNYDRSVISRGLRTGAERNDFYGGQYVKGTDIKMPLTASGSDRERYTEGPSLEEML